MGRLCKMGLVDKALVLLAKLRLEPAVFIFFTCYGVFFATSQQLYIEKACKVNLGHNATVCDNLTEFPETQIESQKLVAGVQGLNGALQSLPTIVVAFFAGPISDRFSRKPLILASLAGYLLLNVIYMVNAFWFYKLKMEFLLFECLQDLTGGDLVFLLGVNSLLVDTTTTDERTTRLIILDAFRFCGRAAGMQIAAHIKTQVLKYFPPPSSGLPWPKVTFFQLGWMAIFGLNFVLIAANLVYILLYVKDKKKPAAAGTSSGCIEVSTSILASYPNLVVRERPPPGKPLLLATFLSLAIFYLNFGQDPLWYLFFRLQYGLSMVDYAHISTAWAFRSAITNFIL